MNERDVGHIAGHSYRVRTVSRAGHTWVHLEEDGSVVASCLLPDGAGSVFASWITAWARRQLANVRECDVCHLVRFTARASPADLVHYLEWDDLYACPSCWRNVRRALAAGAPVRGAPQRSAVGGRQTEINRRAPDPVQYHLAVRPDGRGGTVGLTPLQLAAEVGAQGTVMWWRREYDGETWRYELSVAESEETHRFAVRCHWEPATQRWAVDRNVVAWAVSREALVADGERLVTLQGHEHPEAERYAAGSVWRVTRGLPDCDSMEVALHYLPQRRWLVQSGSMQWCDVEPNGLELRAAELAASGGRISDLITAQQATRIVRQGRPRRHVVEPASEDVIAVEPLREWGRLHQTRYPTLSLDEALLACVSGMLEPGVECWPRDYADHYGAYVDGVRARDAAELHEHTALYVRELRSIEAAMAALATATAAAGYGT